MFEKGKRVFQPESCSSVHLRIINSCRPESWYMSSIQMGKKAELINRGFNVFHAQRSTLQRP
jgi:hypothetical protein